ncbi:uncharacterized protein STEHIDRAFT_109351 [Stereum hirsutum FP-91666 SS1]|uniref:uncharacterized protein n=1 Tax=Stereum hirsutum (strain FP-91666) TaxID=721885 RepID=UPI000440C28C|nr:uncharacterized protein STEHIDRAFT_109351 [Stereum hirsutum FP-91666 SS1]EIM89071.1 hypothetical protein STEHIDRAFT_109351 [Stereum hirsutum FP-91666 SS1]
MLPRRPRLRLDSLNSDHRPPPTSFTPVVTAVDSESEHSHTSVFRSYRMTISVHCNSVKMSREGNQSLGRHLPVFGDHDRVRGTISLDPSLNLSSGRLVVFIEGAFLYKSSNNASSGRKRHAFFSSSTVLFPATESSIPKSATVSSIREAFSRPSMRRKGSVGSLTHKRSLSNIRDAPQRNFPFSFDLPTGRPGDELPPTFSSTAGTGSSSTDAEEIAYRVVSTWEPFEDPDGREVLEVPIVVQPDHEFQSFDGLSSPESWLEIPLRSDRPIPYHCAVTLPTPSLFSRNSSLPYFVVFSTTPKNPTLAREVAMDATITVSLLRQIIIDTTQSSPSPRQYPVAPPTPPSSAGEDSDSQSSMQQRRARLLKRVVSSTPPSAIAPRMGRGRSSSVSRADKPLPQVPLTVTESLIVQTNVSVGFPKRPRHHTPTTPSGHPSLGSHTALPDGLCKGRMQLSKGMMPAIDWRGVSVRYYLEVSVMYGQDDVRTRVPVKIY